MLTAPCFMPLKECLDPCHVFHTWKDGNSNVLLCIINIHAAELILYVCYFCRAKCFNWDLLIHLCNYH